MEWRTVADIIMWCAFIGVFLAGWTLRWLTDSDRLDTPEDLADREKMLDQTERDFYQHEGERLGIRGESER